MARITDRHGRPLSGQLPGLVEAVVIDNVDPEKLGRVKVKYPWLGDDAESHWARVARPSAGKDYGFLWFPDSHEEVLVAFEHGDLAYPIVIGSLWWFLGAWPSAPT